MAASGEFNKCSLATMHVYAAHGDTTKPDQREAPPPGSRQWSQLTAGGGYWKCYLDDAPGRGADAKVNMEALSSVNNAPIPGEVILGGQLLEKTWTRNYDSPCSNFSTIPAIT